MYQSLWISYSLYLMYILKCLSRVMCSFSDVCGGGPLNVMHSLTDPHSSSAFEKWSPLTQSCCRNAVAMKLLQHIMLWESTERKPQNVVMFQQPGSNVTDHSAVTVTTSQMRCHDHIVAWTHWLQRWVHLHTFYILWTVMRSLTCAMWVIMYCFWIVMHSLTDVHTIALLNSDAFTYWCTYCSAFE